MCPAGGAQCGPARPDSGPHQPRCVYSSVKPGLQTLPPGGWRGWVVFAGAQCSPVPWGRLEGPAHRRGWAGAERTRALAMGSESVRQPFPSSATDPSRAFPGGGEGGAVSCGSGCPGGFLALVSILFVEGVRAWEKLGRCPGQKVSCVRHVLDGQL